MLTVHWADWETPREQVAVPQSAVQGVELCQDQLCGAQAVGAAVGFPASTGEFSLSVGSEFGVHRGSRCRMAGSARGRAALGDRMQGLGDRMQGRACRFWGAGSRDQ